MRCGQGVYPCAVRTLHQHFRTSLRHLDSNQEGLGNNQLVYRLTDTGSLTGCLYLPSPGYDHPPDPGQAYVLAVSGRLQPTT